MATKSTTTRSRSGGTRSTSRRRTASSNSSSGTTTAASKRAPRAQALTDDAKTAIKSVRTRATRAAKKVPTDTRTISIAAGVLAGIVAAGVAIFMNRDRLKVVANDSGERLRKAADDLSTLAHDRIDQARDNIARFRARSNGSGEIQPKPESISVHG
jgi:Mce-associated membrane protein